MSLKFTRIDHITSVVLYHAIWLRVHPRMFHKFSCYQIGSSERNRDCLINLFAVKRSDASVTKTLSRNTSNSLSLGLDSSSRFPVGGRGSTDFTIFCATSVLVVQSKCGSSQVIISTTKHPNAQTSVRLEQMHLFAASGANHLRRRWTSSGSSGAVSPSLFFRRNEPNPDIFGLPSKSSKTWSALHPFQIIFRSCK